MRIELDKKIREMADVLRHRFSWRGGVETDVWGTRVDFILRKSREKIGIVGSVQQEEILSFLEKALEVVVAAWEKELAIRKEEAALPDWGWRQRRGLERSQVLPGKAPRPTFMKPKGWQKKERP